MRLCEVQNCGQKHYGKGFCRRHYQNQMHIKEIKLKWQHEHAEKRKATLNRYHLSDKYKNTSVRYRTNLTTRFKKLLKGANDRDLRVTITFEEYVDIFGDGVCNYCIGSIGPGTGLDRLDNSKGYHVFNVVPCCEDCNKLRQDRLTPEETKQLVQLLKKLRNKEKIWEKGSEI